MISSRLIWETLVRKGVRTTTSAEVALLARGAGMNPASVTRNLRRTRRLLPLFRGHYYVPSASEVELGTLAPSALALFAIAAEARGVTRWYFGLETALRHHGLTHEFTTAEWVITPELYRIHGIPLAGRRFIILKWAPAMCRFGIVRFDGLPISDPEKTVLDLAYREFWMAHRTRAAPGAWKDPIGSVSARKVRAYLRHYPPRMAMEVLPWT